jgi:hypothetical protein
MTAPYESLRKRAVVAPALAIFLFCAASNPVLAQSDTEPGTDENARAGLRLRGAAKELTIAKSDAGFQDSVPASFTFQHDLQNDTQTHSAQVFLGYQLPNARTNNINILPYIGLIKSTHRVSDAFDAEQSTEQRKAGLFADIYWSSGGVVGGMDSGYRFIGGLEHSDDHVDQTRVTTASASVRPYVWRFNRKRFFDGSSALYYHPILLLRVDALHFAHRSLFPAVAALQTNARRAGGEIGIAFVHKEMQLNYSFRYIKLHDWKGDADVSHVSHAIEKYFDRDGNVSAVLRFDRGRAEDKFEPERLTSLLLAVRY